jgi:hypothetical protein
MLVPISHLIYPADCLRKAISAYARVCDIRISKEAPARSFVEIEVPVREGVNERHAAHEFLNYLLDISIEWHLSSFTTRRTHGPDKV